MGQHLNRRHAGAHRRRHGVANTCGAGADQNNFIAVLVYRHLAHEHIEKGIYGERFAVIAARIERVLHPQVGGRRDRQVAKCYLLARGYRNILNPEIQAVGGNHQREGWEILVVITHQER